MAIMERGRLQMQMDDFYDEIGARRGSTAVNEMLYISTHTIYLEEGINYKRELFRMWREDFGERLSDEAWEYVLTLYPAFVNVSIIEDMKYGRGISREFVRWKTLVRLEMDLKIIECTENNVNFNREKFRNYLNEKYNYSFEGILDEVEINDIPYIDDFTPIGKALIKHKDQIQSVFEKLVQSCEGELKQRTTSSDRNSRSRSRRRRRYRPDTPAEISTPATASTTVSAPVVEKSTEPIESEVSKPEPAPEVTEKVAEPVAPEAHVENSLKDDEIIIAEYEGKIQRLESDIAEFQRRHDEMREYSIKQYDNGIKDLFVAMNDKRYGKPLDYLYRMMLDPAINDNLRSYLENLFMALKDMKVEPIISDLHTATIDEARLTTSYQLEFDKKDFDPAKTKFKYVGWKYKTIILEKPTLGIKE